MNQICIVDVSKEGLLSFTILEFYRSWFLYKPSFSLLQQSLSLLRYILAIRQPGVTFKYSWKARVSFHADMFESYECSSDRNIQFSINLNILLDCLQLFGSASDSVTAILNYSVS